MYCDGSGVGLGCMLIQKDSVVEDGNRLLKLHEKNYMVHDLKLIAIVLALKQWRYYLYIEREIWGIFGSQKS